MLTACIRNSGFSDKLKDCAFNKSQCQTESLVLFNPLLLIHAKRYVQDYDSVSQGCPGQPPPKGSNPSHSPDGINLCPIACNSAISFLA